MKPKPIRITKTIHASPHELFLAITDPSLIGQWSGQEGIIEPKPGGKASMFDGWTNGTVVGCKIDRAVAYTWLPAEWEGKWESSLVQVTLAKVAGGTKLTIVHSHIPVASEVKSHSTGWHEFFLDPLQEYFDKKLKRKK